MTGLDVTEIAITVTNIFGDLVSCLDGGAEGMTRSAYPWCTGFNGEKRWAGGRQAWLLEFRR